MASRASLLSASGLDGFIALADSLLNQHPRILARALASAVRDGLDLDAPMDGQTPLCRALASGRKDLVAALLEAGADPMVQHHGLPAFRQAVAYNEVFMVRSMLDSGRVDLGHADEKGNTAFHDACAAGHIDLMEMLFQAHAPVLATNRAGLTGLEVRHLDDGFGGLVGIDPARQARLDRLERQIMERRLDARLPHPLARSSRERL